MIKNVKKDMTVEKKRQKMAVLTIDEFVRKRTMWCALIVENVEK